MKYFAVIRYVGTDFCGFQVQPNGRTVQGVLNEATRALFKVPCRITGCSRTDSGVHAEQFCLTIEPQGESHIPPAALPAALLPYLPRDLSLTYATEAPDALHPRYDVKEKEYVYRIRCGGVPDPFLQGRVWQLPHRFSEERLALMQKAAALFVREADFSAFMCAGSKVESTVRCVYSASLTWADDCVEFRVSANGFLYNMVRIMVGTLAEIGWGTRLPSAVSEALLSGKRTDAGMTAPPEGLCLSRVVYQEPYQKILFGMKA